MASMHERFLRACGAVGPVRLAWETDGGGGVEERVLERPALLVGARPEADLRIDHPDVSARHAYLQVVDGRLLAVDLDSATGLLWDGVPRRAGWVDPDQPVRIGPATLWVVSGVEPGIGPCPTSRRYAGRRPLPSATLEFREGNGPPRRYPLERTLVMVGRSRGCQIRLPGTDEAGHIAALVTTPTAVWAVDLGSPLGLTVNGAPRPEARLSDGDRLGLGHWTARLVYGEPAAPTNQNLPVPVSVAPPAPTGLGLGLGALSPFSDEVPDGPLSEVLMSALLDRPSPSLRIGGGDMGMGAAATGSPFGQALLMLIRLLGEVHRDHLELVRNELERIDKLGRDINAMRSRLDHPAGAADTDRPPALSQAGPPLSVVSPDPLDPADPAPRPDPLAVNEVISERILEWERERKSRWRRVLGMLVKS